MDKPILFSIILPTHNRPGLLEKAIRSVRLQDYPYWELIIIDDGTDEEKKIDLRKIDLANIKYYYQENQGKAAARNEGLKKATGDYICFLDDDDAFATNHLSTFSKTIAEQKEFSIFKTGISVYEKGQMVFYSSYLKNDDTVDSIKFLMRSYFGLLDLCLKKELATSHQFSDYPLWQDKHYLIPLMQKNKVCQIHQRTVIVSEHDERSVNKAYKNRNLIEAQVQAIEDAYEKYNLWDYVNKTTIVNKVLCTHFHHALKYEGLWNAWRYGIQLINIKPSLSLIYSLLKYEISYLLKRGK